MQALARPSLELVEELPFAAVAVVPNVFVAGAVAPNPPKPPAVLVAGCEVAAADPNPPNAEEVAAGCDVKFPNPPNPLAGAAVDVAGAPNPPNPVVLGAAEDLEK
ncbi:hypothetical protein G6F42_028217 [Rhizopus arrhizus]|nr:hypothetical protein G6F42_028217 [Rhizopus arrhizus]